jgi:hypothetical protein
MQAVADKKLEEAVAATGARDPRPLCREALREIRRRSEEEYTEAVGDYQDAVIRGIAEDNVDPVGAWIEFGMRLAERTAPGRTVVIDADGRAREYTPPPSWTELILHLPQGRGERAIPVVLPPDPTLAQRATVELLAHGKVKLAEDRVEGEALL